MFTKKKKKKSQVKVSQNARTKNGNRWSDEDKRMALSLFHKSPACYRALKKVFLLPSQSTLYKTMQKIDINAGFCNSVFTGLKAYASGLSKLKREVVLVYDEMSIKARLNFNVKTDHIEGFADLSTNSSQYIANHAGVLMLRSLTESWKQPLGYFLSSGMYFSP